MASAPSSESLHDNSQAQATMFSHSRFRDINQGSFYSVGGDAQIHNSTSSSVNGLEYLHKFIAPSAFHDASERFPQPKCHPSTRERILANIIQWITKDPSKGILWLSGSAGTGKSAIAQTLTEMCKEEGLLAAAFFFFRSSPERNTDKHLIATIAYQIASLVPGTKALIATAVADDLSIFDKDINTQISHLVIHPLVEAAKQWTSKSRFMVVIDGLDECSEEKKQADILSAICDALTKNNLPLCFLIASRPEHQIRARFGKRDIHATTVCIVLDEDSEARRDIEVYLKAEFERIRLEHHISALCWPGGDTIQSLADRASGQFIFASTVIKFIDDRRYLPQKRLDMILGATPCGNLSPFSEIDALYKQILSCVSNKDAALLCLGLMLYCKPDYRVERIKEKKLLLPKNLDQLLQLDSGEAQLILTDLHSIVNVPDPAENQEAISIRHKSLMDFLTDKSRSGIYFLDKKFIEAEITRLYLAAIGDFWKGLKDLASMPDGRSLPTIPLWAFFLWKKHLPEGVYSILILDELSNLAIIASKKNFDIQETFLKIPMEIELDVRRIFYVRIMHWLVKEKLDEKHPALYKAYCSLFDKPILNQLEKLEFIKPMHFIHFLLVQQHPYSCLFSCFEQLGYEWYFDFFLAFFSDPGRSGKFHLGSQEHADIAAWMIHYAHNTGDSRLIKRILSDDKIENWFNKSSFAYKNRRMLHEKWIVSKHLFYACPSSEALCDAIRQHDSLSFPWNFAGEQGPSVARYILRNSQMYEQFFQEERRSARIQSSLHKQRIISLCLASLAYLILAYVLFAQSWSSFDLCTFCPECKG